MTSQRVNDPKGECEMLCICLNLHHARQTSKIERLTCARQIAIEESVTVSIGELTIGRLSLIRFVKLVDNPTCSVHQR